jgi:DNA-binding GntR family transcriptional regulator
LKNDLVRVLGMGFLMSPIIKPSKTIAEKVLAVLEADILSGRYKPGDRMIETEIASNLGVSRGPVREALLILEKRGLIKEKKGNAKGREVASLGKKDLQDFYQVRAFIETQCLIHHTLHTRKILKELDSMVRDMNPLVQRKEIKRYRKANAAFHHRIVSAVGNKKLYELYQDNDRMISWFRAITLYIPRLKKSQEEHEQIMEMCRRGDLAGIETAVYSHQVQALELLLKKFSAAYKAEDKNLKD